MKKTIKKSIGIFLIAVLFSSSHFQAAAEETTVNYTFNELSAAYISTDVDTSTDFKTADTLDDVTWNYELDENGHVIYPESDNYITQTPENNLLSSTEQESMENIVPLSGTNSASDDYTMGVSIGGTYIAQVGMTATWAWGGAVGSSPLLVTKAPITNIYHTKASVTVDDTSSGYIGANLSYASYQISVYYDGDILDRYTFFMTCNSDGKITKTYSRDNVS